MSELFNVIAASAQTLTFVGIVFCIHSNNLKIWTEYLNPYGPVLCPLIETMIETTDTETLYS